MKWFFLSSMPPVWRYWPVYLVVISIFSGLVWTGLTFIDLGDDAPASTAPVLFAGVAVAALAIIANTWSQWQTSRISHALQGLQTLRTDREYLINMAKVRHSIATSTDTETGGPLGPELVGQVLDVDNVSLKVDEPTFRDASLFILNQYEFLAAATRSGAIDLVLMERTLRGPIAAFVTTYSEVILGMRQQNRRAYVNLIWLHETMQRRRNAPYLGPRV